MEIRKRFGVLSTQILDGSVLSVIAILMEWMQNEQAHSLLFGPTLQMSQSIDYALLVLSVFSRNVQFVHLLLSEVLLKWTSLILFLFVYRNGDSKWKFMCL